MKETQIRKAINKKLRKVKSPYKIIGDPFDSRSHGAGYTNYLFKAINKKTKEEAVLKAMVSATEIFNTRSDNNHACPIDFNREITALKKLQDRDSGRTMKLLEGDYSIAFAKGNEKKPKSVFL